MDKDKSTLSRPEEERESTALESHWWKNWKIQLPIWGLIVVFIWIGIHFNIDAKVIAGGIFLFGLLSNAFTWLVSVIAMIPYVGPPIVRVLSLGLIWLLNAIGYLVAFVAIRRGYSKDVLTYRGMTICLCRGFKKPNWTQLYSRK